MTLAERLLQLVQREPGISQAEAARRLGVKYQQLRQVVLGLVRRRVLERVRDDVFRLYPRDAAQKVVKDTPLGAFSHGSEDEVKARLAEYLDNRGWDVEVRYGKQHGPDLVAMKGRVRWIIEVKGPGRYPAMRANYFIASLGEILMRMGKPWGRYSVAFPDLPQFRNLWRRVPDEIKRKLSLTAFFVGEKIEEE